MSEKGKYWVAIGYPENMVDNWQSNIGDLLELPYAYCIHDKDMLANDLDSEKEHDERKVHVHIIVAFPNTTTYKHALRTFQRLNKSGCNAFNTCQQIINIRNKYNYLIHDTETCRKQNKHLYDVSERITGNNFDIGAFEQIGIEEKEEIRRALGRLALDKCFLDYSSFYNYVLANYNNTCESVVVTYQGHFDKICKGNFHRMERIKKLEQKAAEKEDKKND